ncbi:MAG: NYN domain-containing protein [Intrasporangiaceae bacterium]|nr:NYN domain-containing protein [Intrasporangiaceae bacterium]
MRRRGLATPYRGVVDIDTSGSTRIAVLIDCDNVSARHAEAVLEELAKYGTPTVKRAYGDWTTTQLTGWKSELHRHAIQPVQQFAYTFGKNSSDSALIIDAMDLLWQGNVEAFALVSSDSDFTRLATRLRESGKRVLGLGARKTPESLRRAVDQFIFLEVLQDQSGADGTGQGSGTGPAASGEDNGDSGSDGGRPGRDSGSGINLESALTKAVNATSGDDGWSRLGAIGRHLSRAHADFDPRDFGHQRLGSLVAEQPYLETTGQGSSLQVRLKQRRSPAKKAAAQSPATKAANTSKATKKSANQQAATESGAAKKSSADEPGGEGAEAQKAGAQKAGAQKSTDQKGAARSSNGSQGPRATARRRSSSAGQA